jgi:hypothetical protein
VLVLATARSGTKGRPYVPSAKLSKAGLIFKRHSLSGLDIEEDMQNTMEILYSIAPIGCARCRLQAPTTEFPGIVTLTALRADCADENTVDFVDRPSKPLSFAVFLIVFRPVVPCPWPQISPDRIRLVAKRRIALQSAPARVGSRRSS